MLRMASACVFARAVLENKGSAKAIIGLRAEEVCDRPRKTLRLATEGKIVIAWERISQSMSLSALPPGSLVTRSCGGKLVNAPFATMERRSLDAIFFADTPNVS